MDQNTISLIWTIVGIIAVFYLLNMFAPAKEGYQNQEQSGVIKQIDDIKKQQQQASSMQKAPQVAQAAQVMQAAQAPQAVQVAQAPQADAMNISMGQDELTAKDLLPNDNGFASWGDAAPENNTLEGRNFLESGHHFGINTVGQSLKNANVQLRSDPTIPQVDVGPWMQSTIDQDTNRRQFEVSGDY